MNLSNILLVWFPNASLNLYSGCSSYYRFAHTFHVHSLCISIHILVSFLLSVAWHSCPLVWPQLSVCTFSLFLIIISGLFTTTTLCVTLHSITLSHFHVHILAWLCVRTAFQSFRCLVLCTLNNANVHQPYRVSLATHSSSNVASWG